MSMIVALRRAAAADNASELRHLMDERCQGNCSSQETGRTHETEANELYTRSIMQLLLPGSAGACTLATTFTRHIGGRIGAAVHAAVTVWSEAAKPVGEFQDTRMQARLTQIKHQRSLSERVTHNTDQAFGKRENATEAFRRMLEQAVESFAQAVKAR